MIEVKDLTKQYGPFLAVDKLNFTVEQGEVLGFLGPNGAGKTTTMRLLTGYFPPTAGSISLAGFDVLKSPMEVRRRIGYLPENVPLYGDMRVKEYLGFVGRAKGLNRAQTRREAARVMDLLAIGQRAGQLIKQLSKGFRQRVGMAQALMGDPPVLILDEPTIGLDPGQIVEIRGLVKSFAGEKTVILSSHILPEIAATCSKVVIINQGRMAAEGPPSLLANGGEATDLTRVVLARGDTSQDEFLRNLPGIRIISWKDHIRRGDDALVLTLEVDSANQGRAALARTLVEAGMELMELTPIQASLEEVFLNLTRSEPGAGEDGV